MPHDRLTDVTPLLRAHDHSAQPCGCDPGVPHFCERHRSSHPYYIPADPVCSTGATVFSDTDAERKATPIWSGVIQYFPDVMAAVAHVSKVGNDQHNPGEPLHWAREKSTDQMNCAFRHMLDHSRGTRFDTDGTRHLAKAIWRLCAELQLDIERHG